MSWKIGMAKEHFSEVLRRAVDEPQLIHNRERLVASVLGPQDTAAFLAWRKSRSGAVAQALAEARRICSEEEYTLEVGRRFDRANPVLLRVADAGRHKRHK
jgi:hypothetical protein